MAFYKVAFFNEPVLLDKIYYFAFPLFLSNKICFRKFANFSAYLTFSVCFINKNLKIEFSFNSKSKIILSKSERSFLMFNSSSWFISLKTFLSGEKLIY